MSPMGYIFFLLVHTCTCINFIYIHYPLQSVFTDGLCRLTWISRAVTHTMHARTHALEPQMAKFMEKPLRTMM